MCASKLSSTPRQIVPPNACHYARFGLAARWSIIEGGPGVHFANLVLALTPLWCPVSFANTGRRLQHISFLEGFLDRQLSSSCRLPLLPCENVPFQEGRGAPLLLRKLAFALPLCIEKHLHRFISTRIYSRRSSHSIGLILKL